MRRFVALVLIVIALPVQAVHADPTEILIRPDAATPAPVVNGRVDHGPWDALLQRYVNDAGRVDYKTWKAKSRGELRHYLQGMAAVDPGALADKDEQIAYWINVYNALTVHGMLEFYPTRSIKDHVSYVFGFHFWKDTKIKVGGKRHSLDAIEHRILRRMGEPRIHFAIVCASIGCPRLWNHAYTGEGLGKQLDANARHFFAQAQNYRLDRGTNMLYLSSIFDWFGKDFGDGEGALRALAARYVSSEDARYLKERTPKVEFLPYDWNINEQ